MGLFPKDYDDAVKRFRNQTEGLGAQSGVWNLGQGLDIDHRYWPAKSSKDTLFILISGVHGPETYAGHAIQSMFLKEIFPRLKRDRCGVFMVHSLNPYGFKHNRRCTEAGVNLNRNCSTSSELYKIQNTPSIELGERFLPKEKVTSAESRMMKVLHRKGETIWFEDISLDHFIRSVAPGQFVSAEGLEFGGYEPEPQIRSLTARLKEVLPGYRDIVFLDLHTGLGHRGRLHLLSGEKPGCVDKSLMNEIFNPAADREFYEYTPDEAQGFYTTHGSTNDLLAELATPSQRLCALTMEFGTLGHDLEAQLRGLNIWMVEHQGGCYGYANPEIERHVKSEHMEKFFPSAQSWGDSVIAASRGTFTRILQRLGHL